MKNFK